MHRAALLPLAALALCAQDQPRYDVLRVAAPITVDGKLDEPAWRNAPAAGDFHFNWWTAGAREMTVVKALWDDANLYFGYYVHDRHISGSVIKRHGPVSQDDCVEVFLSPNPAKLRNYYGFEINVIGTMLKFLIADWRPKPIYWEPEGVRYRTSHHGMPSKQESPQDDHWILELAIPWSNFSRDAVRVPPRAGDEWRANFNRAGGVTDAQYSTWSPVHTPKPNFHVPEDFGWIRFTAAAVPTGPAGTR